MKGIVRQVGYLLEVYREARSPAYKILYCFEYLPFSRFLLLSPASRHSAVTPYSSSTAQ